MKAFKKIAAVILAVLLAFSIVACNKDNGSATPTGTVPTTNLSPSDITKIADLINYSSKSDYYNPAAVTYSDYSAEETKLANRISKKKEEVDAGEVDSSAVKIFANSDAEKIILKMGAAALPNAKMIKVVDYLAGSTDITETSIEQRTNTGTWSATEGWSFFDDWTYYEKLQDRADANNATDTDKDNVKRQYRNMAGKVFSIGMTGDEFGRVATHELLYSLDVVKVMANNYAIRTEQFTTYCKINLDYDTLVYLEAFNEYYNGGTGLSDCVQLYGYYYDYNKKNYDSVSDENFEKELKYSHQKTYTDGEWLDYVKIQRDNYANAYRYSDSFYETFYTKHFTFQEKKEKWDNSVYGIENYNNLTYTQEMRKAMQNGGMAGQLNMSDWMWCYSGNEDTMKAYNAANTKYENGKSQGAEAENEGKFDYEMQELKMIDYLLTNMTPASLSGALRYEIYNYSGSMVQSIQGNKKTIVLVNNDKELPSEATTLMAGMTDANGKSYAAGKIGAINGQIISTYTTVGVENKASAAGSQSWSLMKTEIEAAMNYDYTSISSWADKVERLEDLVIKRKYDCGVGLDETCTKGNGHAECEKIYDTSHTISQFVSNYEQILKYVGGQSELSFQANKAATDTNKNNYNIKVWTGTSTYNCGFGATNKVTTDMLSKVEYYETKAISLTSGDKFSDAIQDADSDDKGWWEGNDSKPVKANWTGLETNSSQQQINCTYTYTFAGWYLDKELLYKFEASDVINCDLLLYAGYNVTKAC